MSAAAAAPSAGGASLSLGAIIAIAVVGTIVVAAGTAFSCAWASRRRRRRLRQIQRQQEKERRRQREMMSLMVARHSGRRPLDEAAAAKFLSQQLAASSMEAVKSSSASFSTTDSEADEADSGIARLWQRFRRWQKRQTDDDTKDIGARPTRQAKLQRRRPTEPLVVSSSNAMFMPTLPDIKDVGSSTTAADDKGSSSKFGCGPSLFATRPTSYPPRPPPPPPQLRLLPQSQSAGSELDSTTVPRMRSSLPAMQNMAYAAQQQGGPALQPPLLMSERTMPRPPRPTLVIPPRPASSIPAADDAFQSGQQQSLEFGPYGQHPQCGPYDTYQYQQQQYQNYQQYQDYQQYQYYLQLQQQQQQQQQQPQQQQQQRQQRLPLRTHKSLPHNLGTDSALSEILRSTEQRLRKCNSQSQPGRTFAALERVSTKSGGGQTRSADDVFVSEASGHDKRPKTAETATATGDKRLSQLSTASDADSIFVLPDELRMDANGTPIREEMPTALSSPSRSRSPSRSPSPGPSPSRKMTGGSIPAVGLVPPPTMLLPPTAARTSATLADATFESSPDSQASSSYSTATSTRSSLSTVYSVDERQEAKNNNNNKHGNTTATSTDGESPILGDNGGRGRGLTMDLRPMLASDATLIPAALLTPKMRATTIGLGIDMRPSGMGTSPPPVVPQRSVRRSEGFVPAKRNSALRPLLLLQQNQQSGGGGGGGCEKPQASALGTQKSGRAPVLAPPSRNTRALPPSLRALVTNPAATSFALPGGPSKKPATDGNGEAGVGMPAACYLPPDSSSSNSESLANALRKSIRALPPPPARSSVAAGTMTGTMTGAVDNRVSTATTHSLLATAVELRRMNSVAHSEVSSVYSQASPASTQGSFVAGEPRLAGSPLAASAAGSASPTKRSRRPQRASGAVAPALENNTNRASRHNGRSSMRNSRASAVGSRQYLALGQQQNRASQSVLAGPAVSRSDSNNSDKENGEEAVGSNNSNNNSDKDTSQSRPFSFVASNTLRCVDERSDGPAAVVQPSPRGSPVRVHKSPGKTGQRSLGSKSKTRTPTKTPTKTQTKTSGHRRDSPGLYDPDGFLIGSSPVYK